MRSDILIHPDGHYHLGTGDFIMADAGSYYHQKVYSALMSMPPTVASGRNMTDLITVETAIRQYLNTRFASDPDIQPSSFLVSAVSNGSQGITVSLSVSITAPDGTPIEVATSTDYSLEGGSLKYVDFEPQWLEYMNNFRTEPILFYVTIDAPSQDILLPVRPYPASPAAGSRETSDPIYLLSTSQSTDTESFEEAFSIETNAFRTLYPLSRYLASYTHKNAVVMDATLDGSDTNVSVETVDGELCIVLKVPSVGTVTGLATLVTAIQATSAFKIIQPLSRARVYPLKPVRGAYVARFSRTVTPGDYVVKYTGMVEEY